MAASNSNKLLIGAKYVSAHFRGSLTSDKQCFLTSANVGLLITIIP